MYLNNRCFNACFLSLNVLTTVLRSSVRLKLSKKSIFIKRYALFNTNINYMWLEIPYHSIFEICYGGQNIQSMYQGMLQICSSSGNFIPRCLQYVYTYNFTPPSKTFSCTILIRFFLKLGRFTTQISWSAEIFMNSDTL